MTKNFKKYFCELMTTTTTLVAISSLSEVHGMMRSPCTGFENNDSSESQGTQVQTQPTNKNITTFYENMETLFLKEAANEGDIEAQTTLGLMYHMGDKVPKNLELAKKYYQLLAKQGEISSHYYLGMLYSEENNNVKASQHYKITADRGQVDSQNNLAALYLMDKDYVQAYKYFKLAADQLDQDAEYNLGVMHAKGWGREKNYIEANKYFNRAANQGHANAQFSLGLVYMKGKGVSKDIPKSMMYLHLAAEQNDIQAQLKLAEIYLNGEIVQKDLGMALKYAQFAADQGSSEAQYHLGEIYLQGQGVEKDISKAMEYTHRAADQGHVIAQYNLGYFYKSGRIIRKNPTLAVKYYQLAADQGYAHAQNNLGWLYLKGKQVTQNYTLAMKYLQLAANQGNVQAQINLGFVYDNSEGVEKNHELSLKYFQLAADQGNAQAQYNFAIGVEENTILALKYLQLAANQGLVNAQQKLGRMYFYGEKVEKNTELAIKFLQLAADQGDINVLRFLATQYYYGDGGVEKNHELAIKYFKKAAIQGDNIAQRNLQIMYAKGEWVEKNHDLIQEYNDQLAANQAHILTTQTPLEIFPNAQNITKNVHEIEAKVPETPEVLVRVENKTKDKKKNLKKVIVSPSVSPSIPNYPLEIEKTSSIRGKTPKEKFSDNLKKSDNGNIDATYDLGIAYLNGYGIPQNLIKAKEYFETVSQKQNVSPHLKEEADKKIRQIKKLDYTESNKPKKTLPLKKTTAVSGNKAKFEKSKSERSSESSWGLRSRSQSQSESENGEGYDLVNILSSKTAHLADQSKGITIEYTKKFDRSLKELSLSEAEIKRLNQEIAQEPDSNNKPLIKHGGGARKARFAKEGSGKSGSIRIIYTFDPELKKICMIEAYDKKNQGDLTMKAKKEIKKFAREKITGLKNIAHPQKK